MKKTVEKDSRCAACPFQDEQTVDPIIQKSSDFLFIGEAPGEQEVIHNEPFFDGASEAGDGENAGAVFHKYLDPLLKKYRCSITNVVKCHPPGNKTPTKKEYSCCLSRLESEIKYCNPKLIVVLGKTAYKAVTGEDCRITDLNGKMLTGYPHKILVSIHPSYCLRTGDYGKFEKGVLPAIHFFDKEVTLKYKAVKDISMTGVVALDIETTGLRPCGIDVDDEGQRKHDGLIRCVGVASGKEVLYAEIEDKK